MRHSPSFTRGSELRASAARLWGLHDAPCLGSVDFQEQEQAPVSLLKAEGWFLLRSLPVLEQARVAFMKGDRAGWFLRCPCQ